MRKEFTGAAVATRLAAGINSIETTATILAAIGWPTGAGGQFTVVVDEGTVNEEKMLITSRSGTTLTINSRGYDGTTAVSHDNNATIRPCIDSFVIDEANQIANVATTAGDLLVHAGGSVGRRPIGTDGQILTVDVEEPDKVAWRNFDSLIAAHVPVVNPIVRQNGVAMTLNAGGLSWIKIGTLVIGHFDIVIQGTGASGHAITLDLPQDPVNLSGYGVYRRTGAGAAVYVGPMAKFSGAAFRATMLVPGSSQIGVNPAFGIGATGDNYDSWTGHVIYQTAT